MENASKALIIAGAILLSILIIALGMYIFNQARGAMNMDALDSATRNTFNNPIENYEGSGQLGSNVNSLLNDLIANATTNEGAWEYMPTVTLVASGSTLDAGTNLTQHTETDPSSAESYGEVTATGGMCAVNDKSTYVKGLSSIKAKLVSKHSYYVSLAYNTMGLIDRIVINYSEPAEEN